VRKIIAGGGVGFSKKVVILQKIGNHASGGVERQTAELGAQGGDPARLSCRTPCREEGVGKDC
jgi:hypothetical protein